MIQLVFNIPFLKQYALKNSSFNKLVDENKTHTHTLVQRIEAIQKSAESEDLDFIIMNQS